MAITNKLITFNKLTSFETQLAQGNILDTSIVFIKDAKKIWTKGTYFDCSGDIAVQGGGDNRYFTEFTVEDFINASQRAEDISVNNEAIVNACRENKIICIPYADVQNGYLIASYKMYEDFLSEIILSQGLKTYLAYPNDNGGLSTERPMYDFKEPIYVVGGEEVASEYGGDTTFVIMRQLSTISISVLLLSKTSTWTIRFLSYYYENSDGKVTTTSFEFMGNLGEILWANGEMPEIEPNTWYELSLTKTEDDNVLAVLTPFKSV